MPTLLQFATFFNVAAAALVVGLSLLTQRLRPSPFFRWWVMAYAWGGVATAIVATESIAPPGLAVVAAANAALAISVWFSVRVGYALLERPLPAWRLGAALALIVAMAVALYLAGHGYQAAFIPGPLTIMASYLWLGAVMVRVGRTPAYAGMGWIGVPVALHGMWIVSYPVCQRLDLLWFGYGVAAWLEVGVGLGMVMFVLLRTTRQLERQNAALLAAEQALRHAQAERERLQTEFLSAASHELRAPLTSVLGYSELLAEGRSLGPLQAQYLRAIQKGVRRMRRLVDDMLDFASLEAGTFVFAPQAIDVGAIVADEVAGFELLAQEKGVALELARPAAPVPIQADPGRVGQVVANLVGNAIKYTPSGGHVRVTVAPAPGGDGVRVDVRDDGIGVAAEHVPRLFDKHFSVDPSATRALGGAGLGLAICRTLIEGQGGRIGVETAPGQGSTFWFTLPGSPG